MSWIKSYFDHYHNKSVLYFVHFLFISLSNDCLPLWRLGCFLGCLEVKGPGRSEVGKFSGKEKDSKINTDLTNKLTVLTNKISELPDSTWYYPKIDFTNDGYDWEISGIKWEYNEDVIVIWAHVSSTSLGMSSHDRRIIPPSVIDSFQFQWGEWWSRTGFCSTIWVWIKTGGGTSFKKLVLWYWPSNVRSVAG